MSRLKRYVTSFSGFERSARLFLLTTLVSAAAISLYWINFNLYLASLGIAPATIGLIATAGSAAAALIAFPASIASDRIGRRRVLIGGMSLIAIAFAGLLLTDDLALLFVLSACYGAGQQVFFVVTIPFLTAHSRPEHRNELFALQFAILNATNIGAALLGGTVAAALAAGMGFRPESPEAYRVILALMLVFALVALATLFRLRPDRPVSQEANAAAEQATSIGRLARIGVHIGDRRRFVRLLLPGFLISLGAGQVIPFLNVYIQFRFGLELAGINAVFAVTSFGTVLAILVQPALARRFGKIGSVVLVQMASIPFLVVLGFSPLLWTVVIAMAVRNSLMNAGNPIFNAFAMEQVEPEERATLAAAMSLLWSLGWVIAGPWYSLLQDRLGFEGGYTVNFITITVLYSIATALYWRWFRHAEARPRRTAVLVPSKPAP